MDKIQLVSLTTLIIAGGIFVWFFNHLINITDTNLHKEKK